jgi:hypothetical protein
MPQGSRDLTTQKRKGEKKTGPREPSGPDSAAPGKSKIGKNDILFFK